MPSLRDAQQSLGVRQGHALRRWPRGRDGLPDGDQAARERPYLSDLLNALIPRVLVSMQLPLDVRESVLCDTAIRVYGILNRV